MHLLSDEGVSEVLVLTKVFWKYLISDKVCICVVTKVFLKYLLSD